MSENDNAGGSNASRRRRRRRSSRGRGRGKGQQSAAQRQNQQQGDRPASDKQNNGSSSKPNSKPHNKHSNKPNNKPNNKSNNKKGNQQNNKQGVKPKNKQRNNNPHSAEGSPKAAEQASGSSSEATSGQNKAGKSGKSGNSGKSRNRTHRGSRNPRSRKNRNRHNRGNNSNGNNKNNGQQKRRSNDSHLENSDLPLSVETSAGGLVLSGMAESVQRNGNVDLSKIYVALIGRLDRRGRLLWSMPKGHIENDESKHITAEREVWEETGISGEVIANLGTIDYWFVSDGTRIHKTVHHHLLRFIDGDLNDEDPEVTEVSWVPVSQLVERLAYADERRLARRAFDTLPKYARKEAKAGRLTPR